MKSLTARLFLILVLVTLGIQVLSFGGALVFSGREGRRSMYEFLAVDATFVQQTLRQQPVAQRQTTLDHLNQRGHYQFNLEPAATVFPPMASDYLRESASFVQRHQESGAPVGQIAWAHQQASWPALELPLDSEQKLVISFPSRKPPFGPPSWPTIGAYLLSVSLAVMALAWFAVRLATRPISRLADAAQSLGQNLDTPPLQETGPSEVRRATQAFNRMQKALQAHLAERTQILAAISHDLKTPLTRLRLRLDTLPQGEARQKIEHDVDAMNLLIQEGLDYAHSSQLREPLVPVNLNMLVDTLVERYTDMGHDVQAQGHTQAPVRCAPRALERALQNLVDNAIKYGERARLTLIEAAKEVQIQIEDDGPGLAADLLEKVFEPFYRAETSRNRDTGGAGLGLAIAQNLLHAQGAQVSLARHPIKGLIATVTWPLG